MLIYPHLAMPVLVPPPPAAPVLMTEWMSPTPLPWSQLRGAALKASHGIGFSSTDIPLMAWNTPMPGPAIFAR